MFSQYAVSRLAAVRSLLCDFETETSSHLDVHCNTTVSKSICRAATQWTEKKAKKKKLTNDDNYKPVFHVRGEPSCLIGLAKKRSHFADYLQWLLHFLAICDPKQPNGLFYDDDQFSSWITINRLFVHYDDGFISIEWIRNTWWSIN